MPQLTTPQRSLHQAAVVAPLTILIPVVIVAVEEWQAGERPEVGIAVNLNSSLENRDASRI
jgi:hypothetical protein